MSMGIDVVCVRIEHILQTVATIAYAWSFPRRAIVRSLFCNHMSPTGFCVDGRAQPSASWDMARRCYMSAQARGTNTCCLGERSAKTGPARSSVTSLCMHCTMPHAPATDASQNRYESWQNVHKRTMAGIPGAGVTIGPVHSCSYQRCDSFSGA